MAETAAIAPPPQPMAPPQPVEENATAAPSQPMAPPQPMAENATAAPPQPMAESATVVVVVPPPPPDGTTTFLCLILAFFIPPLGVFLKYKCEIEFWICLILTFLAYAPGIIYAVWVIVK
ncbi:oleosin-B6-like [Triticum dicoccoides]|uniref:oleosin-B6-like n=1 Tax=Triticum dicoccoides TaxID=85692 RepID=UPI000E7CE710|nr:oleosin-B6-like [Triticum dicoccoides]